MTIRCSLCAHPIFVGDPVTLFVPAVGSTIPSWATVHSREPLQLVGCLGWHCAESGADRAGFWVPGEDGKGRVHRVPTLCEVMLGTGEPYVMVVDDLADMGEAANPTFIPMKGQSPK